MAAEQYEQKISIVVFGTDRKGEMFQEDTATIVVAATWAKVRLRHVMAPGAEAIVFNKENGNQAEFVVREAGSNEATLALRDHSVDVWQLDFGQATGAPEEGTQQHIECGACHTRECTRLSDEDINHLLGAGKLKRYCAGCMAETEWEEDSVVDARMLHGAHAAAASQPDPGGDAPPPVAESAGIPGPAAAPPAPGSALVSPAMDAAPRAEPSVTDQLLHAGHSAADRRSSKRISLKTRARIRRVASSEVVAPINVSRGGICFQSRSSYELDEVVWVAMHYRDEDKNPMETPSRVVRISRGDGGQPPSYGVSFEV